MEPRTGKRIVSKGAYVRVQGKRATLGLLWCCLLLVSGLFCGITVLMVSHSAKSAMSSTTDAEGDGYQTVSMFYSENGETPLIVAIGGFCLSLGFGGATYYSFRRAMSGITCVKQMDPGVPLTRANTADLRASDSLVRASSEPIQAQQAVLLRAAAEGMETQPEQLVRASVGQE